MGREFQVRCGECSYSETLITGIGMRYSPERLADFNKERPFMVNLIRSKDSIEHIKALIIDKHAIIKDNYEHRVYRCPKCGKFYNRFFIHLDFIDGSYEVTYKCPKCKTILEFINDDSIDKETGLERGIDFTKYPCPECCTYNLKEDETVIIDCD